MTLQLAQLLRYRHEQDTSPIKIMWLHSISNKTGMNELLIVKSATHKQNPSERTEDDVLIIQLNLSLLLLLIEEGM